MPRPKRRAQSQKQRRLEEREAAEGTSSESSMPVQQKVSYADVVKRGRDDVGQTSNVEEVNQSVPHMSRTKMLKTTHHTDVNTIGQPSDRDQINSRGQTSFSSPAPVSDGNPVINTVQTDVSNKPQAHQNVPQVSFADVQKQHGVAGPSRVQAMDTEPEPSESCVCASYSQSSLKYGNGSRNKQCVANSLVFLSFLHENENITTADLNRVLDKGDVLYKQIRQRFRRNVFLAMEELPDRVTARRTRYHVDLTEPIRVGTIDGMDEFPCIAGGLSCLLSEVKHALFMMGALCIAVFRTQSGEYGFFDPHHRNRRGLPVPTDLKMFGTAVMLRFSCLSDMIDRIMLCFSQFNLAPSTQYDIKPVSFYPADPSSPSNVASHADHRPAAVHAQTLPHETVDEPARCPSTANIIPEMSVNPSVVQDVETASSSAQDPVYESTMTAAVINPASDFPADTLEDLCTDATVPLHVTEHEVEICDTNAEPEAINEATSVISQDDALCDADLDISDTVPLEISSKLSKLNKQRRQKMMRRLMRTAKPNQTKADKKQKERQKYSSEELLRAKKKISSAKRYKNNIKKKTQYMRNQYKHNSEIRDRKRSYIRNAYRENPEFRDRQRSYIRNAYRENAEFRQRQREYIKQSYRHNEVFRHKQKMYIRNRYEQSKTFQQKQKNYFAQRYSNDRAFRLRRRQQMRDRYNNNSCFRMMHKIRCAMHVKRKYRQMNRQTQYVKAELQNRLNQIVQQNQTEQENRLINEAISVFRSNIKAGPTYVCTSCEKASFPNQVKVCKRSNYKKNLDVVEQVLTGKYIHVCDETCRNDRCPVPERQKERICHTCHEHLKKGNMPPLSSANNLQLHDIPADLDNLNILERHLIAKCIPFAKILPLPKGRQRQIRGNVVCVPSEISETVNMLPRLRSESQVMRVKLKRRLSYKGHQLFQSVTWSKLMRALLKLKEIHPQYQDVTIRDEASLCDPTLPDVEEESSDDSMDDDEYDEADLMEIDQLENDALVDAENEPESDDDTEQPQEHSHTAEPDELPNGGFAIESCLQPVDISDEILAFTDQIYCVAPAERNDPVSFFKTPKLEAIAFPCQFPTGQNTLDEPRERHVTPSGYFKSRLFHIDERFARDPTYLFFAQFVTEIHFANSSMMIQLRKGKPKTKDGREITSAMLQDKTEVQKLVRNKDAVRFLSAIRGTPAYWSVTSKDLFAMIRQLGTPTFFLTFSAAEFRWPEVITAIKKQQGQQIDFEALDWSEKSEILRSNPVTAMRMFDKRVEALFRDLLFSPAQPLGEIVDFFYRLEFQHRGSPHIHGLVWIKNAAQIDVSDDQTICDFVDRYISAQLPDPDTQPELYRKVSELQKHSYNHTRTCFKSINSGCRFGFPKPPCRKTMIARPDVEGDVEAAKTKLRPLMELLNEPEVASMTLQQILSRCNLTLAEYEGCRQLMNKKISIHLKRDPKDCWINNYNPHLLKAWDANIDVSYILNAYSCVEYLCKYITKQETNLSNYLTDMLQNSDRDNLNECDEMRAVMQAYSKKREVSAQECVTRACGIKMKKSSRSVVFVPTDSNPVKMSRSIASLEEMAPESCEVWLTSLRDKYKARPQRPEYEQMCLADFAANCRFVNSKDAKKDDVFPLLNMLGYVQMRKNDKPAIIRYYNCSKEKHPEEFHERLLRLYLPHRSELELKRNFPTYQSFYSSGWAVLPGSDQPVSVRLIVKQNKDKYEQSSEAIEEALEEYEENQNIVIDEWCNLAPESEVVRLDVDEDLLAGEQVNENEQENVPDLLPQINAATELRSIREAPAIDPAVLRQMYQNLNQKQACVFYAIRDWCIKRVCDLNPEPFFLYVSGGAGTGKSHLIKCIHAEASKILSRLPTRAEEADISGPTVILTAFTGTAAFGISGTTLHSLLRLPRSLKPPIQGLGNKLDEVRAELFNAQVIIIDEISMVSKQLFDYVDARLKQIKGNNRAFGGMSVLAVGDFYQLPPVRHSKPLCVHDPTQLDLWHEHFQTITLTEIMRQKDDVAFAEMLNRIRVKGKDDGLSEPDRELLSQTITKPEHCSTDVLHIFPTNKMVEEHNSATLSRLFSNIITIDADDFVKDPRTNRMARQDKPCKGGRNDLADTLTVAEGARVMLTRNINIQEGLVNGAFGTLMRVVYSENDQRITKLGLRMDNQTRRSGPPGSDDLVYVERAEDNLAQKRGVRRQFPVKLAFACTVHKTQGLTTHAAVVSLKKMFEAGMAYVALSRVTSLSGLYLLDLDEGKIYANPEVTAAMQNMRQASVDDMMPLLPLREAASRPDTLTIVHHNVEGLPSHIDDMRRHHELCLADILCLTETHLQGSFVADSLHLDGYNMFKRNRHVSYTNLPLMASRSGGGVAVYVKNHIQVHEKQYLHNVTDLEFVVLKVEAPVQALIAAVYRPPNYNLRRFRENLVSLLDALHVMDCHPVIVCGDFNENQLSSSRKPILEVFQSKGYTQLITSATTDKNTLLDAVFISQPQRCLHSGVLRSYYSYHEPVFCIVSASEP